MGDNKYRKTETGSQWLTGEDAQGRFKPLTEEIVRSHTDPASFSNGRQYLKNGYIIDAVLRGSTLRTKSLGRSGGPYTIKVDLEPTESQAKSPLAEWDCSCPRGGFCKHIVATLLLWIEQPGAVEVREDMASRLQDRSREELLALVLDMLKREPDLERWVETVLDTSPKGAKAGATAKVTLNPATIERQVDAIFANRRYEWGEAAAMASKLSDLVEAGDRYAEAGQWANAQVVFSTIAAQALAEYDSLQDEEGDIDTVITDCGAGLVRCLDAQAQLGPTDRLSAEARIGIFRSLYDIWGHDRNYGVWDLDESIPEVIRRTATAAEQAQVEEWVRTDLAEAESFSKRALINFLVELKGEDGFTDEQILDEYSKAGLFEEMADLLIQMGRVDAAIQLANERLREATATTRFAEKLLKLGEEWTERAIALVEERLSEEERAQASQVPPGKRSASDPDSARLPWDIDRSLHWLEEHYVLYGMPTKALDVAQRLFRAAPGKTNYDLVKQAALMPGQPQNLWAEVRPGLIATLQAKATLGDLVTLHVSEGAVADALAVLADMEKMHARPANTPWYSYADTQLASYELAVAHAAEKDFPEEARGIYQRMAERHIESRDRGNYSRAAEYLERVKALYDRQGRYEEWAAYIVNLRDRNKTLRALKAELDARGL
jgi:hypothetical protein